MTLLVDPIDLHKQIRSGNLEVASDGSKMVDPLGDLGGGVPIDLQWLRFAAREYQISPNIQDYLLVPVIIVPIGFPNRNGVAFTLDDLVRFSPEHGCQFYKTWTGKPTFYEHKNTDHTKANGVILDVFLRKASAGDYWKILTYLAFDRSKYSELIRRVERRDVDSYSMGAYVTGGYSCSMCGRQLGTCTHVSKADRQIKVFNEGRGDELAYRLGHNPVGFETSIVETPAWSIANSDNVHLVDTNAVYVG